MRVEVGKTEFLDVILATNCIGFASDQAAASARPIRVRHELGHGIWAGPVDPDLCDAIIEACSRPGQNFHPVRNVSALYGVFRRGIYERSGTLYSFDPDRGLHKAVRFSRLVHPTSFAQEYAGRVVTTPGDANRMIVPASADGLGARAYVIDTDSDWLEDRHAEDLRALLTSYDHDSTPTRIKIALFYFEYAAWTYYIDLRWTLLVSAAESLVHVNGEREPTSPKRYAGSTAQFVARLLGLRKHVLGLTYTEDDLRGMYQARSRVVHGQEYHAQDPELQRLYRLLEESLRTILRTLVLVPRVAELFGNDEALRAALPL